MATEKNARQISEERAAAQGEVFNSFKDAGVGAVRSLELNNINEGETVTIPKDFKIFLMPISGTTNKAAKVITEEGKDFWIGCLTRGARPADGSDLYVQLVLLLMLFRSTLQWMKLSRKSLPVRRLSLKRKPLW